MDGVRPVTSNPTNPEEPARKKPKAVEVIRTVIEAATGGSKEREPAKEPLKEPAKVAEPPKEAPLKEGEPPRKPEPDESVDERLSRLRADTRRALAEKKAPEKPAEAKMKQEASVTPRPEPRTSSQPAPPPRPPVNSPAMTVLSQASSPVRRPEEPTRAPSGGAIESGGQVQGTASVASPAAQIAAGSGRSVREGSPVDPSRPSSSPAPGNTQEEKLLSMEHARQAEQQRGQELQGDRSQLVDQGNRARMGVTHSEVERGASERDARLAGQSVAQGRGHEAGLARRVGQLRGDLVQQHSRVEDSQARAGAAQTSLGHAQAASGEADSAVKKAESALEEAPLDERAVARLEDAQQEQLAAIEQEQEADELLHQENEELVRRSEFEAAVAGELVPLQDIQDRAVDLVNLAQDEQAESLSRLGAAGAERGSMDQLAVDATEQRPRVEGQMASSRLTLESLNEAIERLRTHNTDS